MTTANETVLKTDDLWKTYGRGDSLFHALKGVSLDIKKGEAVAIVGKSGSGKSTLMHLLALMDTPTSGGLEVVGEDSIKIKGKHLNELRNSTFGFVFQQFFLNGHDSVLENVILPLKIAGVGSKERKERAMAALEAVELTDKAKAKAQSLSGGQKQRVVIARALVNNPDILMNDEPTGNLDSATGAAVEDLIFRLNKDKRITLIIVTHDPDLAAKCDRQIYIKDGLIVEGSVA